MAIVPENQSAGWNCLARFSIFAVAALLPAAGLSAPVCAACHPQETASYLETGMGNSLLPAAPLAGGQILHGRSGSTIDVAVRNGRMFHNLSERGLTAEYPVAYQIGSGKAGHGYIVQAGDYLIQSPAAWYNPLGWDVAPGFVPTRLLDFDRVITETCLFCHAGEAQFSEDGRRFAGPAPTAITCERCHGPSAEHVQHPSARNIVNPARLPIAARDSICEQCHLEGETRILNPGKTWRDFHPGEDLAQTFAIYVRKQNGQSVQAVSHAEQLAKSRCARESDGKLWCGSCHSLHRKGPDRNREVREVCVACHATLSHTAHPQGQSECVSCHMPRVASKDIIHAAITNHHILRWPGAGGTGSEPGEETLAASREPPVEFRRRDLGLAELEVGSRRGVQPMTEDGIQLLESLPNDEKHTDAAVLSALAASKLQRGMLQEGMALLSQAAEKQPRNALHAFYLGLALSKSDDLAGAEQQLSHAIELDPSRKEPYIALCDIYEKQGRLRDVAAAIDRYLKWNPQSISFRLHRPKIGER
jgi:tetratricopeptide (TPR) repeat protein